MNADFRLSPQQRSQWIASRGQWHAGARFQGRVSLEGPLGRAELERVWGRLVARQEALRTTFHCLAGMQHPVQRIGETRPFEIAWHDLSGIAEHDRERAVVALEAEQARRPFELGTRAGFDLCVVALSSSRHILLVSLSGVVGDARSVEALVADLARCFAEEHGQAAASESAVQYADLAEVFNHLLESAETDAGRRFWKDERFVPRDPWRLPFDGQGNESEGDEGAIAAVGIDDDLAASLSDLAAKVGAPPSVALLACYSVLLSRLTGVRHLPVGARYPGRSYDGLGDVVGAFERYLPVPAPRDDAEMTFAAYAQQLARTTNDLAEWQDYFEPPSADDAARAAQRPFLFSFDERCAPRVAGALKLSVDRVLGCAARFTLRLSCVHDGDTLRMTFFHEGRALAADDVRRIGGRLAALVRDAAARPDVPLLALSIHSPDDLAFLEQLGKTDLAYPGQETIHSLFEQQVRRSPDAVAVVSGGNHVTFAQLNDRANQLAHHLRTLDVAPDVCVGLCLDRSADLLVGVLGILKAGGAYVPLDPAYPKERLSFILKEARIGVVVTQTRVCDALPEGHARRILLDAAPGPLDTAPTYDPTPAATATSLAYVLYTSGSTGKPKGVMIQHGSVVNLSTALEEAIYADRSPRLVVAMNAPLSFDASVKQWLQLLRGRSVCIVSESARLDPRQMIALLDRHAVDVLDCTPSLLRALLDEGVERTRLSLVLVGGEAIDAATWTRLSAIDRIAFFNVYGPTECTVDATAIRVRPKTSPTIGRALANVRVHLLDSLRNPTTPGLAGEIYIGGAGVARGYLARPDLTADRFVESPFGPPGARLYRTGDLARHLPDGTLAFLGRCDQQLKLRGFRIEAGEIETVLLSHPGVAEAAVMIREVASDDAGVSGMRGAIQSRLVAYLVLRAPSDDVSVDLRARLRRELPEYMVPAQFVALSRMPLTANGKVDRAALPEPSGASATTQQAPYQAPNNEVERTIVAIWQSVLGLETVGVHHNFFDLGGHSLLMVQLHEKLCAAFGRRFPLVELFRKPTVSDLAQYLGQRDEGAPSFEAVEDRAQRQREAMLRRQQRTKKGSGQR